MIQLNTTNFHKVKAKFQLKKPWDSFVIFFLSVLITIPLFIILHQNLIDPQWSFNTDRILLFIIILVLLFFALYLLRTVIIVCIAIYMLALTYGTFFGNFSFYTVYEQYSLMLYTMNNNPFPQDLIIAKLLPFPNKNEITKAIEFKKSKVRNFSIMAANKHFKNYQTNNDYRNTIQCFAVFKEINKRWHYVNDPKNGDYIATASESLLHFSGDCDDYSILMAACIKSIGGTSRLIHTKGHIYPEILIGTKKDLEKVNYIIKKNLFIEESRNQQIHFHYDERGLIWLNLDYTANYPGGKFLSKELLGILTLD
jgi:hypothetical protein